MGDLTVTAAQVGACDPEKAEIVPGVAGVAIGAGEALYQIAASGKLGLADEDASAEASHVWGVALESVGAGQGLSVLRKGAMYGFTLTGLNYGVACSLSNNPGALLDTGATTNIVGRVMALSDANLTKVLYIDCTLAAAS